MAITKSNFINYTRCHRYPALEEIKRDKLSADISYANYLEEEKCEKLNEIYGRMYEIKEEEEIDLIDVPNKHLESMLKYYNQVEQEAGRIAATMFGGTTKYAKATKNQEMFDFTKNGIRYLCYVDIYNENESNINIIEVKASTSKKYADMAYTVNKEKVNIFEKINNIYYLKEDLPGFVSDKGYNLQRNKLFNRYKEGKYVFDLAIQRWIIENEFRESNNEAKLSNFKYYLAILNHKYIFDGTYENGEAIYNSDAFGNELITFIDLTTITKEWQPVIEDMSKILETDLFTLDAKPTRLSASCEFKKPTVCKYFDKICAIHIPYKNSALNYINNGHGFKLPSGDRLKGLELINEGYIDLLDIPQDWITSENHNIQRTVLKTKTPYIDVEKIKIGLEQIEYPIYHLDFETFPCPLPRFKGDNPYTQAPFEFSLHIEHAPGICDKENDNVVFLAKSMNDEREELIKTLLKAVDVTKGTLLAQNVPFEKGCLKRLANDFPEYKHELMQLHDRGFDLIWLVRTESKMYEALGLEPERAKKVNFYHENLSGSYSIKKTLPVFTDLKYDDLTVKNGTEAIDVYASYPYLSKEEFELQYNALVEYCKQDTWAMVEILKALRKLVQ